MKKLARVAVFALLMAGAVTASFSSSMKAGLMNGGDPIPTCDPDVKSCPAVK
jgi:hypothetical protein